MSTTVVGLFKSTTEARNVKHELVNQGYSASNIQVVAQDEFSAADSASGVAPATAHDTPGTRLGATISNFFRSLTGGDEQAERYYVEGVRQGGAILSVTVTDGQEEKIADLLERHGARDVNDQPAATSSAAGVSASRAVPEGGSVPVIEESLQVGRRQVQRGGVRVYSHLVEKAVQETVQLREEHVRVDRQSVNRPATEADFDAFKEGTVEFTETAEEAVVSKTARIVEEIVVGKETSERTQTIQDKLRHTEIEVEQLGTEKTRPGTAPAD